MFRRLLIALLLFALEQPTIGAEKAKIGHTNSQATENGSPVPLDMRPAQWPREPQQDSQTYYFYPDAEQQPDKGADAFLGVSSGMWVALFTFALVISSIAAIGIQTWLILRAEGLTRKSLLVSQRQMVRARIDSNRRSKEAAEALAASEQRLRAWLEVSSITFKDCVLNEKGLLGNVTVTIKNIGSTPAELTNAHPKVFNMFDKQNMGTEDTILAWFGEKREPVKLMTRFILPNGIYTVTYGLHFPIEEWVISELPAPYGKYILPVMAVDLRYKWLGDRAGQTAAANTICWKRPDIPAAETLPESMALSLAIMDMKPENQRKVFKLVTGIQVASLVK